MEYVKITLKEEIAVKKIVTVHYFEYARDFSFEGEAHDFWEFLYVDKGSVEVRADSRIHLLKQGEIIFHKPNEFHTVKANGKTAPNLVVIAFECKSKAMRFFNEKVLTIGNYEKNLLAQIIREAREAFSSPLNVPTLTHMTKKKNPLPGSEQMIRISLELMLIHMLRKGGQQKPGSKISSSVRERNGEDLTQSIIRLLEENVLEKLTFDEICRFSFVGKTSLKVIFKENTGMSVMEYYKHLKIEEAKKMIREGRHKFTEIADQLGYSSIHHFSKYFKKATGMTPSQYASSVKVKAE